MPDTSPSVFLSSVVLSSYRIRSRRYVPNAPASSTVSKSYRFTWSTAEVFPGSSARSHRTMSPSSGLSMVHPGGRSMVKSHAGALPATARSASTAKSPLTPHHPKGRRDAPSERAPPGGVPKILQPVHMEKPPLEQPPVSPRRPRRRRRGFCPQTRTSPPEGRRPPYCSRPSRMNGAQNMGCGARDNTASWASWSARDLDTP